MRKFVFGAVVGAALGVASMAHAAITKFDITWSGQRYGNEAVASGFMIIDTSLLPSAPSDAMPLPHPGVLDLSVDVSGTGSGDGHFGLENYTQFLFWSPVSLDLTQELIGQPVGPGCAFGVRAVTCGAGQYGDFNLFGAAGPIGSSFFQLSVYSPRLVQLDVTSIRPATAEVPEPGVWALMVGGFGLAGAMLRRRRAAAA